nr:cytokine receptor-like factor 2 [Pogona vitticeps]
MGRYVPVFVAVLLWIDTSTRESWAQCLCPSSQDTDFPSSCEETDDSNHACINYTIINQNNERMEILWAARENFPEVNTTMFYEYNEQGQKQCPQYITDQGYNTGCVFQAERNANLLISIWDANGTKELYYDEQDTSTFFKPNPPENVTFQWTNDKLTVQCKSPDAPHCFHFQLQYKSRFDENWHSRKESCCKLQDQGFDPVKCYTFRFRLIYHCGVYSSEWSNQTSWENGSSVGSCDIKSKSSMDIVLTLVMVALMIIFVLLLWVCWLERFRQTLMPIIPDPKNIYSELFSGYHGDFQEWINETENVLIPTKLECTEGEAEACVVEDEMEGCHQEVKMEARVGIKEHPFA